MGRFKFSFFDIFGTLSLIVGTMFFIVFVLILPRSWTGSNYEALMGIESAPTLIPNNNLPILGEPVVIETATPAPTPDLIAALQIDDPYNQVLSKLTLINEMSSDFCQIRLIPDSSQPEGIDLLRFQSPLMVGEMRHFEVALGDYVIRIYDCQDHEIFYDTLILEQKTLWTISVDP